MTNTLKNVRVLLCALALSASTHGVVNAKETAAPTPTPTPTPSPSPSPSPTPSRMPGRKLSIVTETGDFKSEFKSVIEAFEASKGNSYNQTLKKGSEIIVMNARCTDDRFGDKVTFSLYSLSNDVASLVKSYLDYRASNPTPASFLKRESALADLLKRERQLIDEVMKILAVSKFPRKIMGDGLDEEEKKVECEPVPVALSLSSGVVSRLEVDDAQSPLVGPKINDGFLHDELVQNTGADDGPLRYRMGQNRDFWEKYGFNRFSTAQDALNAASLLAGTKVLIYHGTSFSLYRLGKFEFDDKKGDAQYDVFKTTPLRKGWKIVAIVRGAKFIQVYNPNEK